MHRLSLFPAPLLLDETGLGDSLDPLPTMLEAPRSTNHKSWHVTVSNANNSLTIHESF